MGPHGTHDYKPVSLRWPVLIPFIFYLTGLIAVVGFVGQTFPSSSDIQGNPDSESLPPALYSAPLVNARAVSPNPTLAPTSRRSREISSKVHYHLFSRADNTTGDDRNSTQRDGRNTTVTLAPNSSSNDGTQGVPDTLVGSENITQIQQEYLADLNETGHSIQFAARVGSPPPVSNINETQGNQTWSPSRFRPRHHDPDAYAQYSGPTQIIQPLINIFYDGNDNPYEGASWINYAGGDPDDPTSSEACWATCNGPAIIFHSQDCWEEWVWYAALEQEARKSNPAIPWKVVDDAYNGGTVCMAAAEKQLVAIDGGSGPKADDALPAPAPVLKIVTLTDPVNGEPTLTVTRLEASAGPLATTLTLRDRSGTPTATVTAFPSKTSTIVTLTDAAGHPTATVTIPPVLETETLRDEAGNPTATVTFARPPASTPTVITLTNSLGVPTLTLTITPTATYTPVRGPPTAAPHVPGSRSTSGFHLITPAEYGLASFLPVLLVTPVCILAQIITTAIRTMLPFHTMSASDGGVPSPYSLTLPSEGIPGILAGIKILIKYRDPVAALSDLFTLLAAVAAALSSEAVGVQLYGASCGADHFDGCFMGIAVFRGPNTALTVMLCVALAVLLGLVFALSRWRTGLDQADGREVMSLGVTARLVGHSKTAGLLRGVFSCQRGPKLTEKEVAEGLQGWGFGLGWYVDTEDEEKYGIIAVPGRSDPRDYGKQRTLAHGGRERQWKVPEMGWARQPTTSWSSLGGLVLLGGLLSLILYYETTDGHTSFEEFMLGQNFGTRILFTTLGLVISLFWDGYYARMSMMEVYRQLDMSPGSVSCAALISPPAVAYTGIFDHFKRREWFVAIVAGNAIIANVSPILLSNVPFNPSQTWTMHLVCAWMTVSFLGMMILTLLFGAMFVRHPKLGMEPDTLAGRIYHAYKLCILDDGAPEDRKRGLNGSSLDSQREVYSVKKAISFFGEEKDMVEQEAARWKKR